VGSPRLAWRPLALLVTDGGPGDDLGEPPPGGSAIGKLGPRDMGCPTCRWSRFWLQASPVSSCAVGGGRRPGAGAEGGIKRNYYRFSVQEPQLDGLSRLLRSDRFRPQTVAAVKRRLWKSGLRWGAICRPRLRKSSQAQRAGIVPWESLLKFLGFCEHRRVSGRS